MIIQHHMSDAWWIFSPQIVTDSIAISMPSSYSIGVAQLPSFNYEAIKLELPTSRSLHCMRRSSFSWMHNLGGFDSLKAITKPRYLINWVLLVIALFVWKEYFAKPMVEESDLRMKLFRQHFIRNGFDSSRITTLKWLPDSKDGFL